MKNSLTILIFCEVVLLGCKQNPAAWSAFASCATNACVKEALAVKDALIADPASILVAMNAEADKGNDHAIGWLYIMRDSVLLNPAHSPTTERVAMQQALVSAASKYVTDPKLGTVAQNIVGEFEHLAILSEQEDVVDQADDTPQAVTGTYMFATPREGPSGTLKVTRTDAESIRFTLECVMGAPAHNQGMAEGSAQLVAPNTYEWKTTDFNGTCRLSFTFNSKGATIKTLEGDPATCGFGNAVVPDQVYPRELFDDPFLVKIELRMAEKLQGRWRSENDSLSGIEIKNGYFSHLYSDTIASVGPYQYFGKCSADCGPIKGFPCVTVYGQDVECFAIIKVDNSRLEMSAIGGTGKTLAYKKVK